MLPRAESRVSKQELQRRHAAVREKMREAGLETLLVSGVRFVSTLGYLRYLTNWAEPFAGEYLLFPLEGEPLFFARTSERVHLIRDVLGMSCVQGATAQAVAREVQQRQIRRLGICSLQTMLASVHVALTAALPGCEFVEAASVLDEVRMVKSPEELEWVRKSAALGDTALEVFRQFLEEGGSEHLAFTEVDHVVKQAGAEVTYFMTGAGPNPILRFMDMATHRYAAGDIVLFNAEIAGPGGYYSQLVRTLSLGPLRDEARTAYAVTGEALGAAEGLLKPGTRVSELYGTIRSTYEKKGYSLNLHPGHSQGLDIFERPLIDGRDEAELRAGMIVVIHPYVDLPSGGGVWQGETFLITADGHQRLHRASRAVVEL